MMTPLVPNAGDASICGSSWLRKLSNCVYRLLTGLQLASPSSQPLGMIVLNLATRPVARSALNVDMPAVGLPAGTSLARHSADGDVADQTPPGPSMLSNSIGGLPPGGKAGSGPALLLSPPPPPPASDFCLAPSSPTLPPQPAPPLLRL